MMARSGDSLSIEIDEITERLSARHLDELAQARAEATCVGFLLGVCAAGLFWLMLALGPPMLDASLGLTR